jgi:uncharacterized protein (DUF3820 family)
MDQEKNQTADPAEANAADPNFLLQMMDMKMPFGKYKGTLLPKLPIAYLEWFARKGFPTGKLGAMLQTVYEIKLNGLEYLFEGLKRK